MRTTAGQGAVVAHPPGHDGAIPVGRPRADGRHPHIVDMDGTLPPGAGSVEPARHLGTFEAADRSNVRGFAASSVASPSGSRCFRCGPTSARRRSTPRPPGSTAGARCSPASATEVSTRPCASAEVPCVFPTCGCPRSATRKTTSATPTPGPPASRQRTDVEAEDLGLTPSRSPIGSSPGVTTVSRRRTRCLARRTGCGGLPRGSGYRRAHPDVVSSPVDRGARLRHSRRAEPGPSDHWDRVRGGDERNSRHRDVLPGPKGHHMPTRRAEGEPASAGPVVAKHQSLVDKSDTEGSGPW